ncbi:MAG: CHAD domain-containing protein [Pseudomonadales bacterium]
MQELEAKFLTTAGGKPDEVLRRFQETLAWAGFRIQPRGRRTVTDIYYDSADQSLRGAGWSYRCRRDEAGRRIGLKEINRARAAIFDREEVEQPVGVAEDLRLPRPGPVQERLSNLLHPDAGIAPLFTVENRRAAYQLSHPDHPRGLVEMAFDAARIQARDRIEFTELELELKDGPHEMLAGILAAVELEPAFIHARLSKYERGLIAAGRESRRPQKPVRVERQSRWLDIGVTHLKRQLEQLKLYEPYAWEGVHVEGVHQMRIATRKARAALRSFAPVLPADLANRVAPGLRWLARMLGAVRDLDVHLEHLDGYQARLESHEQAALGRYRGHLESLHGEAHLALIGALDDAAYDALIADYRALLAGAVLPGNASSLRVADVAANSVVPLLERVQERGRAIDGGSPPEDLHRLRIDAKRLRYQLEFLHGAFDGALDRPLKTLRKLQDRLGAHQDACIARSHLSDYRRQYAADKWERKIIKRLVDFERRRAKQLRRRFDKDWKRFEDAVAGLDQLL